MPKENEILTVLWLIENYVIHSVENDDYAVHGIDKRWVKNVEEVIDNHEILVTLPLQPENDNNEFSSIDDEHIAIPYRKLRLPLLMVCSIRLILADFGRVV